MITKTQVHCLLLISSGSKHFHCQMAVRDKAGCYNILCCTPCNGETMITKTQVHCLLLISSGSISTARWLSETKLDAITFVLYSMQFDIANCNSIPLSPPTASSEVLSMWTGLKNAVPAKVQSFSQAA